MRSIGDILYNFHWVVPGEAARAMQAWAGGLRTFPETPRHQAPSSTCAAAMTIWPGGGTKPRSRKPPALPISTPCWIRRKLPTARHAGAAVRMFRHGAATVPAEMLGRPGPHQLGGRALHHPSRRLDAPWRRRRQQFPRFPYLHFPKQHQRWLKAFLDFAAEDAGGAALAQWVARPLHAGKAARPGSTPRPGGQLCRDLHRAHPQPASVVTLDDRAGRDAVARIFLPCSRRRCWTRCWRDWKRRRSTGR